MIARLAIITLAFSSAAAAQPLTVKMGEHWAFRVHDGEPIKAHKLDGAAKPAKGEIGVSLSPMAGTTMTLTNNSGTGYTYRADLVGTGKPAGRTCMLPPNNQPTLEYWPRKATGVRLSGFKVTTDSGACPQNR
jgi:hypothetical protein